MVGGVPNLGSVVIHIGLSVKLTKQGNLKFSQFTKLDAQINPGCVIWFSIK
jgi:hypothetical protein